MWGSEEIFGKSYRFPFCFVVLMLKCTINNKMTTGKSTKTNNKNTYEYIYKKILSLQSWLF